MQAECRFSFDGARVLVIGASRAGIGAAIARSFAQAGAEVAITGIEAEPAVEDRGRFAYHQIDVTDPGAIRALPASTPALDILVNCAAFTARGGEMEPSFLRKWPPSTCLARSGRPRPFTRSSRPPVVF
jgi:NAD(P)-dependent dehydrogenase (short-subunit alcohol dehydrogenase family)